MDPDSQLNVLIDLAESLGIEVRQAPRGSAAPDSPGGALVRLKGREVMFLDPAAPVRDQLAALAHALKDRPQIGQMYLPPEIRDRLEAP